MSAEAGRRETRILERALGYLQLGYPVFPVCSPLMGVHQHRGKPCQNVGKTPLIAWQAFQTRLPTIDEVRTWWDRWPLANIGMATGRLSGIVVLDADSSDAKKVAMDQGGVDRTPAVWTGKPGGIHYWLAHPGEEVSNFVAGKKRYPGLDFRGDGGYVLVPPSRHVSGAEYRWVDATVGMTPAPVPPWLMDLLHGTTADTPAGDRQDDHAPLDLNDIIGGVPEGGRDDAMWRLACKLRNDNLPRQYAEAIVRQAARACRPPFDEDVALEKVERAYRQYEPEQTFRVTKDAPEPAAYPIQHVKELLSLREQEHPMLVDGILWANRTTWLFSDPNTGKTIFMIALLMHIAAGREFCGHAVKQGPVLVIEEDSPLSVMAEYVEIIADIYEFDLSTIPFYVNTLQGLRITGPEGVQVVKDSIAACEQRPMVVLFDACERLVPSDKFTTKEVDPLTQLFQWLISEGITPTMIDHTNKLRAGKNEDKVPPMDKLYGARAKSAISDVMLYFSGSLKAGGVRAQFIKFRGDEPPSFTVSFSADSGFSLKSDRPVPKSPAEQEALRFFNNSESREYTVQEIEVGTGLKRRTLERVLQVFARRGWIIASGSTRTRTYRRNATIGGLFG